MPVKTFFSNSMARVERIKDGVCSTPEYQIRGGEAFQPPLPISFTSLLPLYHWQHASLSLSAYKPQRKVQFGTGTQLYTPMAFSSVCPENGGRRLKWGETADGEGW
jgi:hypothetical protein